MANEKVWTPEQREAAADIVVRRRFYGLREEANILREIKAYAAAPRDSTAGEFIDLQCELTEAVELLREFDWRSASTLTQAQRDSRITEFLKRHTGGNDGR